MERSTSILDDIIPSEQFKIIRSND